MYIAGLGVEADPQKRLWLRYLMHDATYTHPVLFCVSVAECVSRQVPLGNKALQSLGKTIVFLNDRLSDKALSLHDSTIWVVLSLVIFFSFLRDYSAAMVHMRGLGQMVRLRGGIESFRNRGRMYVKLARLVFCSQNFIESLLILMSGTELISHTVFTLERSLSS